MKNTIGQWWVVSVYNMIFFICFHPVSAGEIKNQTERPQPVPAELSSFIQSSCMDCHNNDLSEGNLNFQKLSWQLDNEKLRNRWIRIHDRVDKGEMPPDNGDLTKEDLNQFLEPLSGLLLEADLEDVMTNGRGPVRRLNRVEYEENLRDLLNLPYLDIKDMLPEDRVSHLFNKSTESLDFSRIQMEAFLNAAEKAVREAVASGTEPRKPVKHFFPASSMFEPATTYGGREAMFLARNSQYVSLKLSEIRKSKQHDSSIEMALFRSPSWPYYGYPDNFIAKEEGIYHVRFSARAVRQVPDFRLVPATASQPMTFRIRKHSGPDVSGDVRGIKETFNIKPETGTFETTVYLKKNETIEYNLLGLPVPRAINPKKGLLYYDFPPMPPGGHPGVAFQWLEITGPVDSEEWPPASHKILFSDLPVEPDVEGTKGIQVIPENPEQDALRLLRRFITHAARSPLKEEELRIYEKLVLEELKNGNSFTESLISGYTAFLCSPHFLYLKDPQVHDKKDSMQYGYHVASRLSHFIWNSGSDEKLLSLVRQNRLISDEVLESECNRLIHSEKFNQFVNNFTDYWLSLKEIRRDEPDSRLYPEYRFDDYLIDSMKEESRAFFSMMVRENLSVKSLVDSDFVLVNDRLARHYELPEVDGYQLQKIILPESSPYGGILTQASVSKVTSNGSSTSPVVRGAWIMERIIGNPPPPPPKNVPPLSPDIRGARTIREKLAKHTENESCASCHAKFDPVGFALENFDIMGAWRTNDRSLSEGEKITGIDRAGHDFAYFVSSPIDPAGSLESGESFNNIRDLKIILADQPRQLAKNLLHQFTTYATGTPVRFSDRPVIEEILDECSEKDYCVKDLLIRFVKSPVFLGHQGNTPSNKEQL